MPLHPFPPALIWHAWWYGTMRDESAEATRHAIERRRRALEAEWNDVDAVVLIGAGDRVPIPGRADRVYPFIAHSEYFYLTDRQLPRAAGLRSAGGMARVRSGPERRCRDAHLGARTMAREASTPMRRAVGRADAQHAIGCTSRA
jgi:hypothetical protein